MTATSPAFLSALLRANTARGWSTDHRIWTSDALSPGFDADQVVASWNLVPASGALIEVCAADSCGVWGRWQRLAQWDALDGGTRTSPAPGDAHQEGPASIDTDVLTALPGQALSAARLRITLSEPTQAAVGEHPGSLALAALHFSAPLSEDSAAPMAPSCASALDVVPAPVPLLATPDTVVGQEASTPLGASATELPTPVVGQEGAAAAGAAATLRPLSQRQHKARTDLGGGGSVWCSPTSLVMVMDAWGVHVPDEWPRTDVPATPGDLRVPWTAARVFDPAFTGTGNWTFNAALAGHLGLDAVVTRLNSLTELDTLTRAGFPVICSVAFKQEDLPGADYSTSGHLLVAVGLDAGGDVRVADPACSSPKEGLRAYPADAFDAAWATSRRTAYLLSPRGAALPQAPEGSRTW